MTFCLPPRSFSLDFPLAGASEAVCTSPHRERVLAGSSRRQNPLPWPPWWEVLQPWPRLLSQQIGERALHPGAGQAAARQVPEAGGVFVRLAFSAPGRGSVGWRKGGISSVQKLNGLRQMSLRALCRKKTSPVCGTRRVTTQIVFTTTGWRSLVAWHSWINLIFLWCLSKTSCIMQTVVGGSWKQSYNCSLQQKS